ncbi:putative peptidase S54, rhomboid [Helianthus debilis subsp. tardiflorus]
MGKMGFLLVTGFEPETSSSPNNNLTTRPGMPHPQKLFTTGLILLTRGVDGNDYCSWCHYLTCIPSPLWSCESHCRLEQLDKQLNMTCLTNQRSGSYTLEDPNDTIEMQKLCLELCS